MKTKEIKFKDLSTMLKVCAIGGGVYAAYVYLWAVRQVLMFGLKAEIILTQYFNSMHMYWMA